MNSKGNIEVNGAYAPDIVNREKKYTNAYFI